MVSPTSLTAAEICVWLTQLWSSHSQTTHPVHSKRPVPALPLFLGHTESPCTLLGCSVRALARALCPCSSWCRTTLSACGFVVMFSLSVGRMHPVRATRVQHLHYSGHHTPQEPEVITCRSLSCTCVTSCNHLPLPMARAVRGLAGQCLPKEAFRV